MARVAPRKGQRNQGGLVYYRGIWVSERLAPFLARLDARAAALGARIVWTSGYRSPAQQAELMHRHESGDPSVPFEPLPYWQSKHATGDAADGETQPASLAPSLGAYARSIGLGWNAVEPWHFEV
jgi:hypothetical protein